jgi:hypothetical protein
VLFRVPLSASRGDVLGTREGSGSNRYPFWPRVVLVKSFRLPETKVECYW